MVLQTFQLVPSPERECAICEEALADMGATGYFDGRSLSRKVTPSLPKPRPSQIASPRPLEFPRSLAGTRRSWRAAPGTASRTSGCRPAGRGGGCIPRENSCEESKRSRERGVATTGARSAVPMLPRPPVTELCRAGLEGLRGLDWAIARSSGSGPVVTAEW